MLTKCYEFEVFKDEDTWLAFPYDMEGGTQGRTFDELCTMVADWLKTNLEWWDVHNQEPPKATFGNEPQHGGTNMLVEVSAGRETMPKVSATEAALLLGVTRGRVTQMVTDGTLVGWRDGRNTWIDLESLNARISERREQKPEVASNRVAEA